MLAVYSLRIYLFCTCGPFKTKHHDRHQGDVMDQKTFLLTPVPAACEEIQSKIDPANTPHYEKRSGHPKKKGRGGKQLTTRSYDILPPSQAFKHTHWPLTNHTYTAFCHHGGCLVFVSGGMMQSRQQYGFQIIRSGFGKENNHFGLMRILFLFCSKPNVRKIYSTTNLEDSHSM